MARAAIDVFRAPPLWSDFVLQRTGARPLRFTGVLIACSEEAAPGWARLRLAVYRCALGGYVAEISCLAQGSPRPWCLAAHAEAPEDLLSVFEQAAPCPEFVQPHPANDDTRAALWRASERVGQEWERECAFRHGIGRLLYGLALIVG